MPYRSASPFMCASHGSGCSDRGAPLAVDSLAAAVIPLAPPDRPGVLRQFADAGVEEPLRSLAAALVRSPPAAHLAGSRLIVCAGPPPRLVFTGPLQPPARLRLEHLERHLGVMGPHTVLLSWTEVERTVGRIARRLRDRVGDAFLGRAALHGAPRGGLILATLLAYELGIPQDRLAATGSPPGEGQPVLVVDDAVYSGRRLRRLLPHYVDREVVLVSAAASPGLPAVLTASGAVRDVVIDRHLQDLTRSVMGDEAGAWEARWRGRASEPGYLQALLAPVIFPWSEPDGVFYNELSGQVEDQWKLGPPGHCVANRRSPAHLPVIAREELPGASRLAEHVVPYRLDDRLVLLDLEHGSSVRLSTAATQLLEGWFAVPRSAGPAGRDLVGLDELCDELRERGWLRDTNPGPSSR